uniref:DNA-directed RNA polymerase subunit n=1 Tax=Felis catus TaxID=9685 RepID=A0ABI8AG19_FELCA
MFVLVEMVDTVRIPPWQFERKLNDSIAEELNKKLANKVVYNVGLCICLFDITKLEDAYVFPGDGASHTKVHFRYVVFHPFLDEILIGKIKGCSPEGVHVSLGFFDDILIPPESLQQPAKFDEAEQVWVWEYETEEGAHDLYMDTGEEIRFRVVDESFVDTSPTGPSSAEATSSSEELPKKEAPYTLVVSIMSPNWMDTQGKAIHCFHGSTTGPTRPNTGRGARHMAALLTGAGDGVHARPVVLHDGTRATFHCEDTRHL